VGLKVKEMTLNCKLGKWHFGSTPVISEG